VLREERSVATEFMSVALSPLVCLPVFLSVCLFACLLARDAAIYKRPLLSVSVCGCVRLSVRSMACAV